MLLVGVLPAGPVGAVVVAQLADRCEYLAGALPLAAGIEGEHKLAGLGDGHPRLIADAADAEARDDERVPAAGEPLSGGTAPQRAPKHRVVPVHPAPALVRAELRVT